ncbi:hypothetical protein [Embleya sp. NPDC050493]|uniref:hypothetical protein n=1 Tax=Embleya sp. NPDC050493 TaxID=3363989 RepID=UPI0037AD0076
MGNRLTRWRPDQRDADQRLGEIAQSLLLALQSTVREDASAFGLYDAACTAGGRLADVMASPPRMASDTEVLAGLVTRIGGEGGTLSDAVVRRAVAAAWVQVQEQHPELSGSTIGRSMTADILCDLYRLFFADVVAEFLRSVVAEKINLAMLGSTVLIDPESVIANWITECLLEFVPDPCEVAVGRGGSDALPGIARSLVPRAVDAVLGLSTPEAA